MSDDLNTFMRKADAMFDDLIEYQERVARLYFRNIAGYLIRHTPGPNLQWPDTTEYIATGRLRAAWTYTPAPLGNADRYTGGPYTEHGDDTLATIEADFGYGHVPSVAYLVNDVIYGYFIQEGLWTHSKDRPGRDWVELTPLHQERFLREAQQEAGST